MLRALPLALVVAALAAAPVRAGWPRRDPPPRAAGAAGESYFPMLAGTRWVYAVSGLLERGGLEVVARGVRPVRGAPAPLFLVDEAASGGPFGGDRGLAGYLVVEGYVGRFSFLSEDADGSVRLVGSEPTWVLPVDPRAGQRWRQRTHVFTTPESAGGAQSWEGEVERAAAVSVPAGRFEDVLVVRSRTRDPTVSDEPLVSYEDYYARGVGLVRSVTRNHQEPFLLGRIVQELVEVEFGGADPRR